MRNRRTEMTPYYHAARRSRACSTVLACMVAVFAISCFALWFGMNSDKDNVPPLLTQLIPAGHCTCQTSTLFNCSASQQPIYHDDDYSPSSPLSPPPSAQQDWAYDYARDHRNWGLSPAQCDSAFNGLFEDVNRAVRYWNSTTHHDDDDDDDDSLSRKRLDAIPLRNGMARAAIRNGQLYVVETHSAQEDHRRKILGVLNSIHRALTAYTPTTSSSSSSSSSTPSGSSNHLNLEFVFSVEDKLEDISKPSRNHPIWVLGRKASEEAVWLMPDFGFWSWENKFNGIGPYDQVVDRVVDREKNVSPWGLKRKQLVWRGKLSFAPKLRRALLDAARGRSWADVKELVWSRKDNFLDLDEHCDYMFIAHVEGRAFSSSLKYRQACRSVVVAHRLQFIQHHHYLLQPSGPQQNFVQVSRDFSDLSQTMDTLLADPERARRIADNNVAMFRERYLTQAAEACYWRALFAGYASVFTMKEEENGSTGKQKEEEKDFARRALRFESFVLLPGHDMMNFKFVDYA